jgi:predicted HTH domain antitoxin
MEKVVRVNTTLYPNLLKKIDFYAEQRLEDRSTAIRQLIAEGLKSELKSKIVESLKEKKLTVREAAQLLNVEYWEMQQIMDEEGVNLIDISKGEVMKRKNNKL